MKSMLLLSTAVAALTAGMAMATPHPAPVAPRSAGHAFRAPASHLLYSQNSNFGSGILSWNETSGSFGTRYDCAAADDFVVPAGRTWTIKEVDVTGVYFNGSGPASSEVVSFYTDRHNGHPENVKASYTFNCTDTDGSFACAIPGPHGRGLKLSGGTTGKRRYWLSVVTNMAFTEEGEWGWVQNSQTHHKPGQWRNPGNGFNTGCTTWNDTSICLAGEGEFYDDYAFDLRGSRS